MAESPCDLVVSLPRNADHFAWNTRSVNKSIELKP